MTAASRNTDSPLLSTQEDEEESEGAMICNEGDEIAELPSELEPSIINAAVLVISPDAENRNVSELELLSPISSVSHSIEKITKGKRKGNNNCQQLTEIIITAVNKIMKTDESTQPAQTKKIMYVLDLNKNCLKDTNLLFIYGEKKLLFVAVNTFVR